jgi:CRISPR-associated protein Cmr6
MPRSVPEYMRGLDFSEAPPGHRFSLYWETDPPPAQDKGGRHDRGLKDVCSEISEYSQRGAAALRLRQEAIAAARGERVWSRAFVLTSPFATGLGIEHPSENGFAFLSPHGLPYLSGSGLKGVIRSAARQLAAGDWGDAEGWSIDAVDDLFGSLDDADSEQHESRRGLLEFWDVLFVPPAGRAPRALQADIMTPHMRHYLQPNAGAKESDSPHPHGVPNPVKFLVVPPGWECSLHVAFNAGLQHSSRRQENWRTLLEVAVGLATEWIGFGAKTAVGYGRFFGGADESAARAGRLREVVEAERQARRAAERSRWSERQIEINAFVEACERKVESGTRDEFVPSKGLYQLACSLSRKALAEGSTWTLDERQELAGAFEEWLPKVIAGYKAKDASTRLKLASLRGNP